MGLIDAENDDAELLAAEDRSIMASSEGEPDRDPKLQALEDLISGGTPQVHQEAED